MDPVADLLTRIRNSISAGKTSVSISHSGVKEGVLRVLEGLGYVQDIEVVEISSRKKNLNFNIAVDEESGKAKINDLQKVSKPSRRIYMGYREIKPVRAGYGHLVLSTPSGVITGEEARERKVGGEALLKIW